jgi:predicted amidophosphoribosyltransferase
LRAERKNKVKNVGYLYEKGKEVKIEHKPKHRIGRRGLCANNSSLYGKCADCGKPNKLLGFLCRRCYLLRDSKHRYHTDSKFRKASLERARKWREKNGKAQ